MRDDNAAHDCIIFLLATSVSWLCQLSWVSFGPHEFLPRLWVKGVAVAASSPIQEQISIMSRILRVALLKLKGGGKFQGWPCSSPMGAETS